MGDPPGLWFSIYIVPLHKSTPLSRHVPNVKDAQIEQILGVGHSAPFLACATVGTHLLIKIVPSKKLSSHSAELIRPNWQVKSRFLHQWNRYHWFPNNAVSCTDKVCEKEQPLELQDSQRLEALQKIGGVSFQCRMWGLFCPDKTFRSACRRYDTSDGTHCCKTGVFTQLASKQHQRICVHFWTSGHAEWVQGQIMLLSLRGWTWSGVAHLKRESNLL